MCLVPKPSLWGRVGWGLFAFFGRPTCLYIRLLLPMCFSFFYSCSRRDGVGPPKGVSSAGCSCLYSKQIGDCCVQSPIVCYA